MAKVVVELGGIKRKVSPQALAKGKLIMNNQVMMSMNPYVPYRDGALRGSSRANSVGVTAGVIIVTEKAFTSKAFCFIPVLKGA